MEQQYNYTKLREHLTAYFEKGLLAGFKAAQFDLDRVKSASNEALVALAEAEDFNMDEYLL